MLFQCMHPLQLLLHRAHWRWKSAVTGKQHTVCFLGPLLVPTVQAGFTRSRTWDGIHCLSHFFDGTTTTTKKKTWMRKPDQAGKKPSQNVVSVGISFSFTFPGTLQHSWDHRAVPNLGQGSLPVMSLTSQSLTSPPSWGYRWCYSVLLLRNPSQSWKQILRLGERSLEKRFTLLPNISGKRF